MTFSCVHYASQDVLFAWFFLCTCFIKRRYLSLLGQRVGKKTEKMTDLFDFGSAVDKYVPLICSNGLLG